MAGARRRRDPDPDETGSHGEDHRHDRRRYRAASRRGTRPHGAPRCPVRTSRKACSMRPTIRQRSRRVPPVVTIMGHVDHGKTSLLDAIRQTNVVERRSGRHHAAHRRLPGGLAEGRQDHLHRHARPRGVHRDARAGAKVTDLVILVVAADDGVMPQTVEAINHAKAAKVPMIVAINKIDKADAKAERVRSELLQYEVQVESLGGDVLDVEVSATKKTNLDKLLETIALQAELLDLKANPKRRGRRHRDRGQARSRPRSGRNRAGPARHAAWRPADPSADRPHLAVGHRDRRRMAPHPGPRSPDPGPHHPRRPESPTPASGTGANPTRQSGPTPPITSEIPHHNRSRDAQHRSRSATHNRPESRALCASSDGC